MMSFNCGYDHQFCIVAEVARLMNNGYRCYLEYDIEVLEGKKVVVDILAKKGKKSILIEVGSLSPAHLDLVGLPYFKRNRLALLRRLMPKTEVHHITQWKNWINTWEFMQAQSDEDFRVWRIKHHREEQEEIDAIFGKW
jgi:Holliday junction resolvase